MSGNIKHHPFNKLNLSAKMVLVRWQKIFLLILCVLLILSSFFYVSETVYWVIMFFNVLFFITNTYRFFFILVGGKIINVDRGLPMKTLLARDTLPTYTVLVPLFKEVAVLNSLVNSLSRMNYPKDKLTVMLVLEEEDIETIEAVYAIKNLPSFFKPIIVPKSEPQTKAKACNYALKFVNSELVCIFDAEDRPDPNQLMLVANKFALSDHDVACVQCRLCFYNGHENLLTTMFEIEYQALFNFVLPVATHFDLPVPLGGSSNHFRTKLLNDLGGWDPYNVTEDADLGLRLSAAGYRTRMLLSYTPEEATVSLKAWMSQRTRWLKGYFHTFFIYFRYPYRVAREFNFYGMIFYFYIMLLGPLLTLCTPAIILLSLSVLFSLYSFDPTMGIIFKLFTFFNLFYTILMFLFTSYLIAKTSGHEYIKWRWIIFAIYFILHTIAAFIALYKLVKEPHKWDKTTHGVTKIAN